MREINQDTSINFRTLSGIDGGTYNETLDTSYYGAYLAIGGEYELPFFRNVRDGLGLEAGFKAYAGLYGVDSDYRHWRAGYAQAVTDVVGTLNRYRKV